MSIRRRNRGPCSLVPNRPHPKVPVTITETPCEDNGYSYVVEDAGGQITVLRLGSIGAPKEGKVGDKGTIQYHSSPSFAFYSWAPTKD